jgi:hypothetical protein
MRSYFRGVDFAHPKLWKNHESPAANGAAPPPRFTVVLNWTSLLKK